MERTARFIEEARQLAARLPGALLRVRRLYEDKPYVAYLALPASWSGEKRIVILLLAENGSLITAVAPPVPHPYCVSRGSNEPIEAKAVDEALYELGSRYTGWCRVYLPPGFRSERVRGILEALVELGVVDEIGPWRNES